MKESEKIRVMIVEDHFVVRTGLAAIINSQPDMMTIVEARNGREAIELFREHQPDVTLMDLRIPLMSGTEAIAAIVKEFHQAKIIVLSTFGGDEDIFKALQAGARAYFLKDVKGPDLIAAIRAVNAGQRLLPPHIAARLAERIPRSELSPRELEILLLIAKGGSNKEIANTLDISEGTVRVHASNIFSKLGCNDRAQAVSEAFQRGIIHID
ncbi:MAG TPA: response regulator transcription factor [Pyrinomonadaceae bacterium]|jgi:two-component system NarL family response regulator|nr:response regulator transcription factor [Pyrinomonadaceae bacterium]